MRYKIKLLPEALLDIKEIIEWYNEEKPGLGKPFLRINEIKAKLYQKVSFALSGRLSGCKKYNGRQVPLPDTLQDRGTGQIHHCFCGHTYQSESQDLEKQKVTPH